MKLGSFAVIGLGACVMIAGTCTLRGGDVGSAGRDLRFAKDNAESERWDDFVTNMKKAESDMEGLSDSDKTPLKEQIDEIRKIVTKSVEQDVTKRLDRAAEAGRGQDKLDTDRAALRLDSDEAKGFADAAVMKKLRDRLAGLIGSAPAPDSPQPAPPVPNQPQGNMSEDVATAVTRMRTAHSMFEQGSADVAEKMAREAVKLVQSAPDAQKAPVLADAAALKKQIDEAEIKAQRDEEARRVEEQVHRYVFSADQAIESGVVCNGEWIGKSEDLLASRDVQTFMDPAKIKDYQSQLDAIRAKLRAHNVEVSLERSAPTLKELQDNLAQDPFKEATQVSASSIYDDLQSLSHRARHEFDGVPKDDPKVKAVLAQIAAADAKIEAAAGKWALKQVEEGFARRWEFTHNDFDGWESEKLEPSATSPRAVTGLEKTTRAIRGTLYWLNEPETKETAGGYKTDPVVVATMQAANKTLDGASAKLNDAYNAVVAQAERDPMPSRESDRAEMDSLASDAERWFDGTRYKDANAARARKLSEKWKAEVARAQKEMEETLKRMTAEANAAWPAIEAAASPEKGFDPSDAERWKGKVIIIKGYYNRSGWDFDAAYDWAATIKGQAVAGTYDDRVRNAFNEGSKHTQFGIDDHIGWDVIAIVQGPGTIKRRVRVDWRDKDTHELLLKTESNVPEPCVTIKIIGLHAGPVAVGPK